MMLIIIPITLIIIGAILVFKHKNKKPALLFEPIFNFNVSDSEHQLFQLINAYRKSKGLKEVKSEYLHSLVAKKRIEYCQLRGHITHDLFFAHNKNLRVRNIKSAENLAENYTTPSSAMKAWTKSQAHNDALLNPKWQYCGIAIENNMYCLILGRLR